MILDEIGRGTSTFDGISLAWAITEHIHDAVGCRTLFATHYHELVELEKTKPRLRNANVAVSENQGEIVFLHRIVPGGADQSYGIHVARLAGVPAPVLDRASEILAFLEKQHGPDPGLPEGPDPPQGQDRPRPLRQPLRGPARSAARRAPSRSISTSSAPSRPSTWSGGSASWHEATSSASCGSSWVDVVRPNYPGMAGLLAYSACDGSDFRKSCCRFGTDWSNQVVATIVRRSSISLSEGEPMLLSPLAKRARWLWPVLPLRAVWPEADIVAGISMASLTPYITLVRR